MVPKHFLLYFEKGTTQLTLESEAILPQILQAIKDRNSVNIDVIGHSDTAGTGITTCVCQRKGPRPSVTC
jgi:outer membrane protein OmpA-like peptidoglycan-associated protein